MTFLKQTSALTLTALHGLRERRGAALVTVIGVTTVVGVLISLLALSGGARKLTRTTDEPNEVVVLGSGAVSSQDSVLTRSEVRTIANAPGILRTSAGKAYFAASTMVSVDAIRKDGTRGTVALVGWTPGIARIDPHLKLLQGRMYRPGLHEVVVSEPLSRMYRGLALGDRIDLRGTEWKVVGIFAPLGTVTDSTLRTDAATVMSAFSTTAYQEVIARLASPRAFAPFKAWLASNPALRVQVKTEAQDLEDTFKSIYHTLDFIAYFIGTVMAIGAIFGALNSLYASVDARRRELATLRAIGFGSGPIIASVLIEGVLLALPGALLGAALAWLAFNGHAVSTEGLVLELTVTPALVGASTLWAIGIGLLGGSLPALRAARAPVAVALRAT